MFHNIIMKHLPSNYDHLLKVFSRRLVRSYFPEDSLPDYIIYPSIFYRTLEQKISQLFRTAIYNEADSVSANEIASEIGCPLISPFVELGESFVHSQPDFDPFTLNAIQ